MARARRTHRILLVNGYTTVQHLRALMLRMEGYSVDTAADLNAARAVIATTRAYDLAIVDVGYFADEGIAFCEEIKKKHPDLKVLMQVNEKLFVDPNSCPDEIISRQEGPQHFVREVERLLQAS
jgi:DNA-binding NtrC family response regulator